MRSSVKENLSRNRSYRVPRLSIHIHTGGVSYNPTCPTMLRHPPMLYRVDLQSKSTVGFTARSSLCGQMHIQLVSSRKRVRSAKCEVKVVQIKGGCTKIQRLKNLHSQGFSASHPCISRHQVLSVVIVDVDKV